MDARDVLQQAPLAEATLRILKHVLDPAFLEDWYEDHRAGGHRRLLGFSEVVGVLSDCLTANSSVHRKAVLEEGFPQVSEQAFYAKLGRLAVELSEDFLFGTTQRLIRLTQPGTLHAMPQTLHGLRPILVDGRAIKHAAKRLLPTRQQAGAALGGKTLTALDYQKGLIVAIAATADGEANETTLVERLVEQLAPLSDTPDASQAETPQTAGRPLFVADRQYGDLTQPQRFLRAGEFLLRLPRRVTFSEDPARAARTHVDGQGRSVQEQWGWLGQDPAKKLYVRRIAVMRQDGEEVVVVTSLRDGERHGALDLLDLYRQRWNIESVFREVVQRFELRKFIGSRPQAMVFQTSFCMLLYNVVQTQRHLAAQAVSETNSESDADAPARLSAGDISTANLFDSIRRSLSAVNEMVGLAACESALIWTGAEQELRERLLACMKRSWNKWLLKRNRPAETHKKPTKLRPKKSGGHFSVQRVLDQHRAAQHAPRDNV